MNLILSKNNVFEFENNFFLLGMDRIAKKPDTGYPAFGLGRLPDIQPDIWLGQIPDIWPDIRPDIGFYFQKSNSFFTNFSRKNFFEFFQFFFQYPAGYLVSG